MDRYCGLFCVGVWPFLIAPLLLLVPLLYLHWHDIELSVASSANEALQKEASWAVAETYNRGRDILLTGTATDQPSVDRAIAVASQAEGVRTVDFVGEIVPAPIVLRPPSVNLSFNANTITLSGALDSQDSIARVVAQAEAQFGRYRIQNSLTVGEKLLELPDLGTAFAAVARVDKEPVFALSDNRLTIGGVVTSDERRTALAQLVASRFAGELDNQIRVVAPPCQLAIKGLLEGSKINFASGSAAIRPASGQLLQSIAEAAKQCEAAEFEVSGHTDSIGDEEANQALSEQRAQAVIDRLAELGLNPDRFKAVGFGAGRPRSDNGSEAGRAANRRIEFRVTN